MDLHGEVKQTLGIGDGGATRALGVVFRAVRMTMNAEQFQTIQEALPDVEVWLKAAPIGGGRTAEMLAIVGPEALGAGLKELGLRDGQVEQVCKLVGNRLAESVPDVAAQIAKKLPALQV